MGFMKGSGAVRRTLKYLEAGDIMLRSRIKIVTFQFNIGRKYPYHDGLRAFVYWHLPQLKYKNPKVQFVTFKELTPTPWIKTYMEDGSTLVIDCDSRSREEIHAHVKTVLGKTMALLQDEEAREKSKGANPANFGEKLPRHCICEVQGQIPCPNWFWFPNEWRGKYAGVRDKKIDYRQAEALPQNK